MDADNSGDVEAADALFHRPIRALSRGMRAIHDLKRPSLAARVAPVGPGFVRVPCELVAGIVSTVKRLTPLRSRAAAHAA
jgi:hypothetical protein